MTLDEAIKHAEKVAKAKEREAKINRNHGGFAYDNEATRCSACAEEHRQLAEWLKELKQLREQTKWIPVSERLPEVGSEVLVCFDFKGKRSVYISDFYGDGEFHGLDDEYLTSEGRKYRKAVAWMPLPKHYVPDICVGKTSEIPTGAEVLDKIRAEIDQLETYYDNDYFSGNRDSMFKCNEVLQIIDKYKASPTGAERSEK